MAVFASIITVGLPFIIWDILVANSHWMFNKEYILGFLVENRLYRGLLFEA